MPLHVGQGIDSHWNYDKLTRIRVARCSVFNWTVWYFGSLSVIKMIEIPDVAHVLVIFKEPCPPCKQYGRPRMCSNRAQLLVTTLPAGG